MKLKLFLSKFTYKIKLNHPVTKVQSRKYTKIFQRKHNTELSLYLNVESHTYIMYVYNFSLRMKAMMSFQKYKQEFHRNFSKLNFKIEKNENEIEKLHRKYQPHYTIEDAYFEKVSTHKIEKFTEFRFLKMKLI